MKKYKDIILNMLLDKYERSSIYKKTNTVSVSIAVKLTPDRLPDYYNEYSYESKQEINEHCMALENQGLVEIVWRPFEKGNIIDKVILNIDTIEDAYCEAKRQGKQSLEDRAISLLQEYHCRDGWFGKFVSDMLECLNNRKSVKKYLDIEDSEFMGNILRAIDEIIRQEAEVPKRIFSVRIFNDSKTFERLESRVARIIRDYTGFEDDVDVLSEFNIVSNPGFVYLKGSGCFRCNDQVVDLYKLGGEIGLSTALINSFAVEKLEVDRVITIENLTTFHSYNPQGELVVYLGGYHNSIRRSLLKKIYDFGKHVPFYHWGDIDLGGFRIFNHLVRRTGIPFSPFNMSVGTLIRYGMYAKPIDSKTYIDSLGKLLEDQEYEVFHKVIRHMIEHEVRLEQEAIQVGGM